MKVNIDKFKYAVYKYLFKDNIMIFESLLQTKNLIDDIESVKGLPSQIINVVSGRKDPFFNLNKLKEFYNDYNVKKYEIKKFDFAFIYYVTMNNPFSLDSKASYNNTNVILKANQIIFSAPSIDITVDFEEKDYGVQLNQNKYRLIKYKECTSLNKKYINNSIEEFNNILKKTKELYEDCDELSHNKNVEKFVSKYKDYKELVIWFFINADSQLREDLFKEVKKSNHSITLIDIENFINILNDYIKNDGINNSIKYNSLELEFSMLERDFKENSGVFKHINALLRADELENTLIKKESVLNKRMKV